MTYFMSPKSIALFGDDACLRFRFRFRKVISLFAVADFVFLSTLSENNSLDADVSDSKSFCVK